jgi:amidohydrolase
VLRLKKKLLEIFDYLHEHPEISWQEINTTKFLANWFQNENIPFHTFSDCTGGYAEIGTGKPVIAVRADMDALWQEVAGTFRANHSCGHDAHMTIVLGSLLLLKEEGLKNKGTVRFIFQPAEEKGTGALAFIEKGIVDDVDYLYGIHLRPKEELRNGTAAPAIYHGASRFISGKIIGEDAHGARPHLTANAIEVGADLVHFIKGIYLNPKLSYSAKLTNFHAGGESKNIIPGSASFSIDVRAESNDAMHQLYEQIVKVFKALEVRYDVKITYQIDADLPAAVVSDEAASLMKSAIIQTIGEQHCMPSVQTTGGDDFHYYTIKRPNIKATMLALGCDLQPGLHHPKMTFDKDALITGAMILKNVIQKTLSQGEMNVDRNNHSND